MASWTRLGDWWQAELAGDDSYEEIVTPLLLEVMRPEPGHTYLDLGCGDGRVMESVVAAGGIAIGLELVPELASLAGRHGPVVVGRLPNLHSIKTGSVDGALMVLVLEHLKETDALFAEVARVVRTGGMFALVINHPTWTAPESTPITDEDGEVLWRPGGYFESGGSSEVRAGEHTVTFFHRTVADLLNAAADAGWALEKVVERPHHELVDQVGIPRLMACRWSLIP